MATLIHAILGYIFLTIVVRVLTRRPGGQMTLAEFVLVFLMGGVIILATVGTDRSMTNCLCAVLMIASLHRTVSWLKIRFPKFGELVDGTPLLLVRQGVWQHDVLKGVNMAEEDVMASARLNGVRSFDQIDYATLERNGGISIIRKEED
jgi:uncharacterized membrane protein YcaP (DUF421 family)